MHKSRLTLLAAVLAIGGSLAGTALHAQGALFPQTLPPNSVVGRLGAGQRGPAQAIPFTSLGLGLGIAGGLNMFPGTTSFYINSSTGNDSNDCQADPAAGAHAPCLTVQHGVDVALAAAGGGGAFAATTLFVNGNFTKGAWISAPNVQAERLYIVGFNSGADSIDDTTGATCGTLVVSGSGTNVLLDKITLKKTVSCGGGDAVLFVQSLGVAGPVTISGPITFGPSVGTMMRAEDMALIETGANAFPIHVHGASTGFFSGANSGELLIDGGTIDCDVGSSISNAWYVISDNATITGNFAISGCGSVGGQQFNIANGAVIDALGASTTIPGSGGFYSYGAHARFTDNLASLGTCTNGVIDSNASDDVIRLTFTGNNSSCAVNFFFTKSKTPVCTASGNVAISSVVAATTGVTLTGTFTSASVLNILCQGNPN